MHTKHMRHIGASLVAGTLFYSGYQLGQRQSRWDSHSEATQSDVSFVKTGEKFSPEAFTLDSMSIALIDWDNCLCNTLPRIQKRLSLVAQELERRHAGYHVDQRRLNTPWTKEFSEHLQQIFGESYWQEAKLLYFEYMDHDEIPPKQPFPGAQDILESLVRAKIPFAIVSNSSTNLVHQGIELFGWRELLHECPVIAADSVSPTTKPNPEHFLKAIEALRLSREKLDVGKIVIIGDGADSDMLGALNLAVELASDHIKVYAVWVTHGQSIDCQLRAFSNFSEVRSAFPEINSDVSHETVSILKKLT